VYYREGTKHKLHMHPRCEAMRDILYT